MPLNKEAFVRYRVINRCLVDYKFVSKDKLIEACEDALEFSQVSKRTIDQDIHDMRIDSRLAFYAPIKFDRFKKAYYYEDEHYSIDKLPLNNHEMEALNFTASMLKQYENIELFNVFQGAVRKISDALKIKQLQQNNPEFDFIEFETVPATTGSEQLTSLIDYIKNQKVIRFNYLRFNAQKGHDHTIHPYFLKEFHNRWYVIGLHDELKQIRTYGIDRISELSHEYKLKYIKPQLDFKEYFSHTIGISMPESPAVEIILRFNTLQGKYILTQPIHESQEIIENNDECIKVRIFVNINYEIISLILGWGKDVVVEQPLHLRNTIVELYQSCLANY